jgi:hypothetical protein
MRTPTAILALGAALLLPACTRTPPPQEQAPLAGAPAWISRPAAAYPSSTHLSSVGVGDTRLAAEQKALERLSQEITATVQSVERRTDRYQQTLEHRTTTDQRRSLLLLQGVEIRTARELLGADIAEAWRDPATSTHYALAILDRRLAARAYTDAIDHEHRLIRDALRAAADAERPLPAIRELETAREAARRRDDLIAARRIIAPPPSPAATPQPEPAPLPLSDIRRRLENLRAALRIDVVAAPDAPFELRVAAQQLLIDQGVPPSPPGPSDLKLVIDYDAQWSTTYDDDRRLAAWWLRVALIDAHSGRTLDALFIDGRAANVGLDDPRREALHAARAQLVESLPTLLRKTLGG